MSKPRRPRRRVDGILLLDKPVGLSSNAALQDVRRLFGADKAGHTGSLDPLASGVLPICLGEATKLSGVLLDADKCYVAEARLGLRTATGDAEGEVIETGPVPGIDALRQAAVRMTGRITQVPPMYSALKHEGQRLYALARQGIEVERAPREVRIHVLDVTPLPESDRVLVRVQCSKGTYIRTLVEDLARAAGGCAHLAALRRTAVAPFEGLPMHTLDELQDRAAQGGTVALDALLLAPAAGLSNWPRVQVAEETAARLARGQAVGLGDTAAPGRCAVTDDAGRLLGLGEVDERGSLRPRRWLLPNAADGL